ncbi:MAG: hypothetical protein NTZ83_04590 [Candidatus Pacearchaeota archaeon]|nr:hypothetical protein [Candidatus Pacearchaeota archaeon]
MEKLIRFAVNLLERENGILSDPDEMPSQNPEINPSQNPDINPSQNPEINSSQNPNINPSQNPNWRSNQWELFKETILWEHLTEDQKNKCKIFLRKL